jgi:hypothetical protein
MLIDWVRVAPHRDIPLAIGGRGQRIRERNRKTFRDRGWKTGIGDEQD